jgi:hypothetical protein
LPRQRQDSPVESVELRIAFRADRATANRIKEAIPFATVKRGGCEVRIEARQPGEVMERAKVVLEKLRAIERTRA